MKTVKLSLLAVVVATAVSPSAFAGDTVEAATTELTAIQPGMSQSEIDQKIGRFLERTGNSAAAQNYLIAHDYRTTTPQENTAASPVQPANTLNPITNQAQTDHDGMRIALDGVASKALRLHDVEKQNLEGNALEQAVANAIFPQEDLRGSVAYKRYITGVLVADLYADCQQAGEEAV